MAENVQANLFDHTYITQPVMDAIIGQKEIEPVNESIIDVLLRQVRSVPHNLAIITADEKLTYAEMNTRPYSTHTRSLSLTWSLRIVLFRSSSPLKMRNQRALLALIRQPTLCLRLVRQANPKE